MPYNDPSKMRKGMRPYGGGGMASGLGNRIAKYRQQLNGPQGGTYGRGSVSNGNMATRDIVPAGSAGFGMQRYMDSRDSGMGRFVARPNPGAFVDRSMAKGITGGGMMGGMSTVGDRAVMALNADLARRARRRAMEQLMQGPAMPGIPGIPGPYNAL